MTRAEFRNEMLRLVLRRARERGIIINLSKAMALADGFVEEAEAKGVKFE